MDRYPPGFLPVDGGRQQQPDPFFPEAPFQALPLSAPPGFPFPTPLVGIAPFPNQVWQAPFNAVPFNHGGQPAWFVHEPQGFMGFRGPLDANTPRSNSFGVNFRSPAPFQHGAPFRGPIGSAGFGRPAWVDEILATDLADPNHRQGLDAQRDSRNDNETRNGNEWSNQNARKRGKEADEWGAAAKRQKSETGANRPKTEANGGNSHLAGGQGKGGVVRRQDEQQAAAESKAASTDAHSRGGRGKEPGSALDARSDAGGQKQSRREETGVNERREGRHTPRGHVGPREHVGNHSEREPETQRSRADRKGAGERSPREERLGRSNASLKDARANTGTHNAQGNATARDANGERSARDANHGRTNAGSQSKSGGPKGGGVFQLSTPLQRHREPPATSPLATAIKQQVQLWQNAKAGAVQTDQEGGIHSPRAGAGQTDQGKGGRTPRAPEEGGGKMGGGHSGTAQLSRFGSPLDRGQRKSPDEGRKGRARNESRGPLHTSSPRISSPAQLAQRLAQVKEQYTRTPSPFRAPASRGQFERDRPSPDPVAQFIADVREGLPRKPDLVPSNPPSNQPPWKRTPPVLSFPTSPKNERLARLKERLSSPPLKVERPSSKPEPDAEPETPRSTARRATIKERLSTPPLKNDQPSPKPESSVEPEAETPRGTARLAQIKERLSHPLAILDQPSPNVGGNEEPQTPGSVARLAQIKERLSFPTPKPHPQGDSKSRTSPAPLPSRGLQPPQKYPPGLETSPKTPISAIPSAGQAVSPAPKTASDTRKAGGVNGDAATPGSVNGPQSEAQAWKVPEKLQKLLDEGLLNNAQSDSDPPSAQALGALNLMHNAARLSKKQLQRVKVQAQESRELLDLERAVGVHNLPVIMQAYWEARSQVDKAAGTTPTSGEPQFSVHEQLKILRQMARRSRRKLGKLRKKGAAGLQQVPQVGVPSSGALAAVRYGEPTPLMADSTAEKTGSEGLLRGAGSKMAQGKFVLESGGPVMGVVVLEPGVQGLSPEAGGTSLVGAHSKQGHAASSQGNGETAATGTSLESGGKGTGFGMAQGVGGNPVLGTNPQVGQLVTAVGAITVGSGPDESVVEVARPQVVQQPMAADSSVATSASRSGLRQSMAGKGTSMQQSTGAVSFETASERQTGEKGQGAQVKERVAESLGGVMLATTPAVLGAPRTGKEPHVMHREGLSEASEDPRGLKERPRSKTPRPPSVSGAIPSGAALQQPLGEKASLKTTPVVVDLVEKSGLPAGARPLTSVPRGGPRPLMSAALAGARPTVTARPSTAGAAKTKTEVTAGGTGVNKPVSANDGFLAELRAKALASQRRKVGEADGKGAVPASKSQFTQAKEAVRLTSGLSERVGVKQEPGNGNLRPSTVVDRRPEAGGALAGGAEKLSQAAGEAAQPLKGSKTERQASEAKKQASGTERQALEEPGSGGKPGVSESARGASETEGHVADVQERVSGVDIRSSDVAPLLGLAKKASSEGVKVALGPMQPSGSADVASKELKTAGQLASGTADVASVIASVKADVADIAPGTGIDFSRTVKVSEGMGNGMAAPASRQAYIKRRKNVLVRRVTPKRGTMARGLELGTGGASASQPGQGGGLPGVAAGVVPPGNGMEKPALGRGLGARKAGTMGSVQQRTKALLWQRAPAASGETPGKSPRTPLLRGPRIKQGGAFGSPQGKPALTWKLGGPVGGRGGSKPARATLRTPFKTPLRGPRGSGVRSGKKPKLQSVKKGAVQKRPVLKWTRGGGVAITPWRTGGAPSLLPTSDEKGSLLTLLRQLRGQRSYTSTYATSTNGLSLKRTGAVGIMGNLKWTLSGGKRRREAVEKAAKVVQNKRGTEEVSDAAISAKKLKAAASARATARSKRVCLEASLRRRPGAGAPNRERMITVGLATYKMDPSGRTLVRVSEPVTPGAFAPPATTPKRASVNGHTYVRQGTSDRLVIDPRGVRKTLATGRLKWSLQNARRRKAVREERLCPYFSKYGKCNREGDTCPYVHDKDKVAICTKFVLGRCENPACTLTHKIIPERMPVCSYFLEGTCTNERCPFRHVSVAPNAPVCREFLQGFCPRGEKCPQKHVSVCPKFAADGQCEEGDKCGFYHPTKRTWTLARALREAGRKRKRACPAKPQIPPDLGEGGILLPADDPSDSETVERPRVRKRYFEHDVSEVARKIKPAFLFDDV